MVISRESSDFYHRLENSNLVFSGWHSIHWKCSLYFIRTQNWLSGVWRTTLDSPLSPSCPADNRNGRKGDRMFALKRRMVRVVLMCLSTGLRVRLSAISTILTPTQVVPQRIPLRKTARK